MRVHNFSLLALFATAWGIPFSAHAAIMASYAFEGPQSGVNTVATNGGNSASFAPTTAAAGLTASNLFATGGGTASSSVRIGALATGLGYAPAQGNVLVVDTPGGGDINNLANYFSISITPNAGNVIDFDNVTLQAARSGGATPRGFKVRSSLDGFAATLNGVETEAFVTQRPTLTGYTVNLGSPAFDAISSPIEFRFYPFAPNLGQTLDMDNFAFNGEITAVPESSSLAMAFVGLIGAGSARRRA